MIDIRSFVLGVATSTLITCTCFLIGGWLGMNANETACSKLAQVTGEQTKFIRIGLTDSKCFITNNGQWLDIKP